MNPKKNKFVSSRYPYIPVTLRINKRTETFEALLDTGFDGDIVIPEHFMTNGAPPDSYLKWSLADKSSVLAPSYLGTVQVANLGDAGLFAAIVRGYYPTPQ